MKREIFKFCLFFWTLQSVQVAATPNWPTKSVTQSLTLAQQAFSTKNQTKLYELSLGVFAKIYNPQKLNPTVSPGDVVLDISHQSSKLDDLRFNETNPIETTREIEADIQQLVSNLQTNSDMLAPSLIANLLEKRGLIDSHAFEEITNARHVGSKLLLLVGSMLPHLFEDETVPFVQYFVEESTSGLRQQTYVESALSLFSDVNAQKRKNGVKTLNVVIDRLQPSDKNNIQNAIKEIKTPVTKEESMIMPEDVPALIENLANNSAKLSQDEQNIMMLAQFWKACDHYSNESKSYIWQIVLLQ